MSSTLVDQVREKYAQAAASTLTNDSAGVAEVARAFGYSADELASLPAEANLGLSCGNPTATAHLREGEVVVDLGCGAGIDILLAAKKVGPSGKAIGIDMTPEMLERARRNAAAAGATNTEFHQSTIDSLPVPTDSVDCLISNCVINLAPDKNLVFREMFRVLKPGGRVAVSDIAIKRELPPELADSVAAYVGCISGAISISDYEAGLKAAGFDGVQVVDTRKDLNAYAMIEGQSGCCSPAMDSSPPPISSTLPISSSLPMASAEPVTTCCAPAAPTVHEGLGKLIEQYDVNEYAASVQVYAVKPC